MEVSGGSGGESIAVFDSPSFHYLTATIYISHCTRSRLALLHIHLSEAHSPIIHVEEALSDWRVPRPSRHIAVLGKIDLYHLPFQGWIRSSDLRRLYISNTRLAARSSPLCLGKQLLSTPIHLNIGIVRAIIIHIPDIPVSKQSRIKCRFESICGGVALLW